jgi:large subunit ribosomal protein L25
MAGGDLRLNNRKLKVKALPKNLPDFVELILHHLTWVTNYMLLKFHTDFKIMQQHSNLSSEDFSCSYESSSRAAKAAKHL